MDSADSKVLVSRPAQQETSDSRTHEGGTLAKTAIASIRAHTAGTGSVLLIDLENLLGIDFDWILFSQAGDIGGKISLPE